MDSIEGFPSSSKLLVVVALLATAGFIIIVGNHTCYQTPVENAQVLAGLVNYPKDNPYFLFQRNAWSLINQLCAMALKLGVTEESLSVLVGGISGAISFSALGLLTLALTKNHWISMLAPFLMYTSGLLGFPSANYPIGFASGGASHGTIGLAWGILAIGLSGCGRIRLAAFLLGLGVCVHLSLNGFYLICFVICLVIIRKRYEDKEFIKIVMALASGLLLSGISLLIHKAYYAVPLPEVDGGTISRLLRAFLEHYEFHRYSGTKVLLSSANCIALLTSILAFADYMYGKRSNRSAVVAAFIIVISANTILFILVDVFAPSNYIKIFMSWRLINILNLCLFPFAFGLLGRGSSYYSVLMTIFCTSVITVAATFNINLHRLPVYIALGMSAGASLFMRATPISININKAKNISLAVLFVFNAFVLLLPPIHRIIKNEHLVAVADNYKNVPEIYQIHKRPGLLVTYGGARMVQMCTRRPLLLGLDNISSQIYAPQTLSKVHEILDKVYGISVLDLPANVNMAFSSAEEAHLQLWQARRADEWLKIKADYGATDVLTPPTWKLQLPLVLSTDTFSLYEIR